MGFLGFEWEKAALPAVLTALAGIMFTLQSEYNEAFMSTGGYIAASIVETVKIFYSEFVYITRPAEFGFAEFQMHAFIVTLVASGYLISCIVIYAHRQNSALNGLGKRVFPAVFAAGAPVFLAMMGRADWRILLVVSLVTGYLIATVIWRVYDLLEAYRISKRLRKERKMSRYFEWGQKRLPSVNRG